MSNNDWGNGYDAGQLGILKAIETAELIATMRERKRILKLIENCDPQIERDWLYEIIERNE